MADIQYFLGANTPAGFYSLYHQLSDPTTHQALYILKGGPGCGKSSLMRRVARHAQAEGLDTITVPCSGDPDSLDALILPDLGAAIVDGTAPHVVEPACPGAVEKYIDLSQFYRWNELQGVKEDILATSALCSGCYKRVYRCLGAAGELLGDIHDRVASDALTQKLARRARGIITREVRGSGALVGEEHQGFLSAVTHRGVVTLWDTVKAQADRVYELWDSYGLAHDLLAPILSAALATGHRAVACPNPMAPDRLAHLILPDLSLAFVTSNQECPWPHHSYRRLRLDAMIDRELYRSCRPRLRFARKVAQALTDQGIDGLAQAKAAHDRLEGLYNPHVDFEGVYETADRVAGEILSLPRLN